MPSANLSIVDSRSTSPLNLIMHGEQIPSLSAGMPVLLKALTDENIGFREITDIVSKFPDISSRLLFLSNSAWAAPVVPVSSIVVACSTLGLSVVRSISLALSIASPFNPMRCNGFDSHKFWLNSLMVAEAAKMLATKVNSISADILPAVHTAGVMHNIGMLWLADRLPQQTSAALQDSLTDSHVSADEGLVKHCGLSYPMVGGKLAHAWDFPEILTVALLHHNDTDYSGKFADVAATIGVATQLVDFVIRGEDMKSFHDDRLDSLGLNSDQVDSVVEILAGRHEDIGKMVSAFLSAV